MLRTVGLKVQVKTVFRDCAGFSQAFSALKRKSTPLQSLAGTREVHSRVPRTSDLLTRCPYYGRGRGVGAGRGVGVERGAGVDVAVGVAVAVAVAVAVGVGVGLPQLVGM
jgi:hypothetical protein